MAAVEDSSLELAKRLGNLFLKFNDKESTSINQFSLKIGIPNTTIDDAFNKFLPIADPELYKRVRESIQMVEYSSDRILELANDFIKYNKESNMGLRAFSEKVSIPRTTLKGLFKKRLPKINIELSMEISRILYENENKKLEDIEEVKEDTIELAELFIRYNSIEPMSLRAFSDTVRIPRTNIRVRFDKILPLASPELNNIVRKILSGNRYNRMISTPKIESVKAEERKR